MARVEACVKTLTDLPHHLQNLWLRPDFPQAMEYLGETYVLTGKREDGQQLVDRLRTLDATQAAQLEKALGGGGSGY